MQLDDALLPGQPLLGEPRRLADRGGELLVAAPADAAGGDRDLLPGTDEVVAGAVPALDLGARGDAHDQLRPLGAGALGALAVAAALGAVVGAALERLQVAQRVVAAQHDVAAAAAVAAVRAALGDVRLPPERDDAVAAPAGADFDPRAVGEHQWLVAVRRNIGG